MTEADIGDDLFGRLRPYLETARDTGGDILDEVGSELTQKTSAGITSLGLKAAGAVHRSIRNRLSRAKATKQLDADLKNAQTSAERETAHRRFLNANPFLKESLAALLERRDYLLALADACDDLPIAELVPGNHRLRDVYVAPTLVRLSSQDGSRIDYKAEQNALPEEGSHIVFGDAGSGKSSLARYMAGSLSRAVLESENAALDQLRLPVYVQAADLIDGAWASALQRAVTNQLGLRNISRLSENFFDPHSPHGHRIWTVLVDGFDEIDNVDRRLAVYRAIVALHTREPECFRYILFARPESIPVPEQGFEAWRIAPLSGASRIIERYLKTGEQRTALKRLLDHSDYREIARNPFFVAMAATLITESPQLPSEPFALVEAFIERGVENVVRGSIERRNAVFELLSTLAATPGADVRRLVLSHREACAALSGASAALSIRRDVDEALRGTGLLKPVSEGGYQFLHRIIDRHIFAESMAQNEAPDREVWTRHDPNRLGWASVEQLIVRWAENGEDVANAVEALGDFGRDGRDAMLRLAVQLPHVPDRAFDHALKRLIDKLEDGSITAAEDDLLPRLAGRRPTFRSSLRHTTRTHYFSYCMLPAASALAKAGFFADVRQTLLAVIDEEDGDPSTQVSAARVLFENGESAAALACFRRIAEEAPDSWERLDAATQLYKSVPDERNLDRLRELILGYIDDGEPIGPWSLRQIIDLGQIELVLPLLRQAAQPRVRTGVGFSLDTSEQLEAARLLGTHRPQEGVAALRALLVQTNLDLRSQAELLAALDRIEPGSDAREKLSTLVRAAPADADWRVIEILIERNMDAEAWHAAKIILTDQLRRHSFDHRAREITERILLFAPEGAVEKIIDEGLARCPTPDLAASLSLVGRSADARRFLHAMLEQSDKTVSIHAARRLATVGGRPAAIGSLVRTARDRAQPLSVRKQAAEALQHLGETKGALAAYYKLVRDPRIPIAARCKAAEAYAEMSKDDNDNVLDILEAIATNRDFALSDRLLALLTGCEIDYEGDFLWNGEELFWDIVDEAKFAPTDAPLLIALAKQLEIDLARIPTLMSLLADEKIATNLRISGLEKLTPNEIHADFAFEMLARIALDEGENWRNRVDAIKKLGAKLSPEISHAITALSKNEFAPPRWRLAIVEGCSRHRNPKQAVADLEALADDSSIAISIRLEAHRAATKIDPTSTFPDFSKIDDLDTREHIAIIKAAHGERHIKIAEQHLSAALTPRPLPPLDLVELRALANTLNDAEAAAEIDREIADVPLEIMLHTQDTHEILEIIDLLSVRDPAKARARLRAMLNSEELNAWSFPEVVRRLALLTSEKEAFAEVQRRVDAIIAEICGSDDPSGVNIYLIERFLEQGWTIDGASLLLFAANEKRRYSERVSAAVLALRKCDDASAASARKLIDHMQQNPPDYLGEAISAGHNMLRGGLAADALRMAQHCLKEQQRQPKEMLYLAKLFDDLGHTAEADNLIRGIALPELADAFLTSGDKERLQRIFGDDAVDGLLDARTNAVEYLIERLHDARERIDEDGDVTALRFVHATAADAPDSSDRLEAIDALEQLGYRALPRALFRTLDLGTIEPLWIAEQCSRFGWRNEALFHYRAAIGKTCADNSHMILAGFADLGAFDDIAPALASLASEEAVEES